MIYGDVVRNKVARTAIGAGRGYMREIVVPSPGLVVARVAMRLDGLGGTVGLQQVTGFIASAQGAVLAQGSVVVASGQPEALAEVPIEPGLLLDPGSYWAGVYGQAPGGVARLAGAPLDPGVVELRRFVQVDPGPLASSIDDVDTTTSVAASIYVHAVPVAVPRPGLTDEQLVLLPWGAAQAALSATGPAPGERWSATVGWHGQSVDASGDSTAIVRTGGPLAAVVGERLKVTRRTGALERSVFVLVVDEQPWPEDMPSEDLSLARRAWLALGDWALEDLECTVEVLS